MDKIKSLIKKCFTREVILYGIFGVLTTLVNIGCFTILTKLFNMNENLANFIAIPTAVIFAYFTNRKLVFNSEAVGFKANLKEFGKFILGRAFTMILEYFGCWAMFEYVPIPDIATKLIMTVIVIIVNFFISKFFAFKKVNKEDKDNKKEEE